MDWMNTLGTVNLRIGAWKVEPDAGQMTRDGETVRLEPRTMRLLLCLAERTDRVVSADTLLDEVWSGVVVTPDSVYQAIASLRRLLGDDPKQPRYIMTVPRKGYKMVAEVEPWREPEAIAAAVSHTTGAPAPSTASPEGAAIVGVRLARPRRWIAALACASMVVVLGSAFWIVNGPAGIVSAGIRFAHAAPPQKSIAVLPFLDLTEEMKEEYFADGITEELIGRFSKIPDFKVPAPTSSFYYKGKQITVEEFARKLDVKYVLDGSVRKSETTVRVATRLMKADNGFVIWSATYDRPVGDLLMIQDDIGEQVAKVLKTTINTQNAGPPTPRSSD
jgi:transcriptional activator of cad operon